MTCVTFAADHAYPPVQLFKPQIGDFLGDIGRGAAEEAWYTRIREEYLAGNCTFDVHSVMPSLMSAVPWCGAVLQAWISQACRLMSHSDTC